MLMGSFLLLLTFHCRMLNGAFTSRTLSEILQDYHTLDRSEIKHEMKRRSVSNSDRHTKHMSFKTHGQLIELVLFPNKDIVHSQFQAVVVDEYGEEKPIFTSKEEYYKGYVSNDLNSHATVHMEEDGMLTAHVQTSKDTFYVEPMWRHVSVGDKPPHDMIVYKVTDVKWNLTHANSGTRVGQKPRSCGANGEKKFVLRNGTVHEENVAKEPLGDSFSNEVLEHKRTKRSTVASKNMCNLVLVADYLFVQKMAQGKPTLAVNYMLQAASFVNNIYQSTNWPGIGTGIGFQVEKVKVHTKFSVDSPRYNTQKNWNVDQLLTDFSREDWSGYCLAHLFTYQDFKRGVIGLAYIASSSQFEVGGICTKAYSDSVSRLYLNTGLSSSLNWGRRLLTREAQLVTAHELGHNFGSNHDPSQCSSSSDGKYIMYATSVAGDKPNNDKFSPCSKEAIAAVLKTKRACFKNTKKFCGNRKVEEGEECDPGLNQEGEASDNCCHNCKLRSSALCSDANSPCCKKCNYASKGLVCQRKFTAECKDQANCTGLSATCPKPKNLTNKEECSSPLVSKGNCINGKYCSSLCEQKGYMSCSCDAGVNACKICCKKTLTGLCFPIIENKTEHFENDGMPCLLSDQNGYCLQRSCVKSKKKVKDEFSDLLSDFSFSNFARFMEANIVGTILVFSLIIWIPAGCMVNYLDKKQDEEHEEMKQWMNPFNKQLVRKGEHFNKFKMFFKRGNQPVQKLPRTQYHISS